MWRVDTSTAGLGGAPFYTQMFFDDGVGVPSDVVDAVVAFWEALDTVIVNELTMTVEGVVAVVDETTGMITGVVSTGSGAGVVGTSVGEPAALATQGLIQWQTGDYVNGRQIRGKTFIPGVATSAVQAGKPTAGYQAALNTAANALIANASVVFGIYSRVNHTLRDVTVGSAWNDFAVLRSRRD